MTWSFLAISSGHTVPVQHVQTDYSLCRSLLHIWGLLPFQSFLSDYTPILSILFLKNSVFWTLLTEDFFFWIFFTSHTKCGCPAETLPKQTRPATWLSLASSPSAYAGLFLETLSQVTFISFLIYHNPWIPFFLAEFLPGLLLPRMNLKINVDFCSHFNWITFYLGFWPDHFSDLSTRFCI